jgi:hypothetical protein
MAPFTRIDLALASDVVQRQPSSLIEIAPSRPAATRTRCSFETGNQFQEMESVSCTAQEHCYLAGAQRNASKESYLKAE